MFYIFGLGNPGHSYERSRHSIGRAFLFFFQKEKNFSPWKENAKKGGAFSAGSFKGENVELLVSDEFMNKSGATVKKFLKNISSAKNLIVIHDEIDLPFGTVKAVYNRGSGGHKGVESVDRALKTKNYFRIRVGISPTTPKGKIKKPDEKEKVVNFVLGNFTEKERGRLEKEIFKNIEEAISRIIRGDIPPIPKKGGAFSFTIR
jgi:PTH1 family peptidyl-tRNA hydrolase